MVEKDKNLDLECALRLAAAVQSIKVDASTIRDVRKPDTSVLSTTIVKRRHHG